MEKENTLSEIDGFLEENYDIYMEDPSLKTQRITDYYDTLETRLLSRSLKFEEKGLVLYYRSALLMMLDKGDTQLERDLLKSVRLYWIWVI